jgi:hypothetical protein
MIINVRYHYSTERYFPFEEVSGNFLSNRRIVRMHRQSLRSELYGFSPYVYIMQSARVKVSRYQKIGKSQRSYNKLHQSKWQT